MLLSDFIKGTKTVDLNCKCLSELKDTLRARVSGSFPIMNFILHLHFWRVLCVVLKLLFISNMLKVPYSAILNSIYPDEVLQVV